MTRLYPRNAAALDRGLERALGLPTIPELGLPIPGKNARADPRVPNMVNSVADIAGLNKKRQRQR